MSVANDSIYRVISISVATKKAMKTAREQRGITNSVFLQEAVDCHLDALVNELQIKGLTRDKGPLSPIRLPLSKKGKTLDKLRSAGLLVQVPVSVLMAACIKTAISQSPAADKRTRKRIVAN
jgi:hypothetical protein